MQWALLFYYNVKKTVSFLIHQTPIILTPHPIPPLDSTRTPFLHNQTQCFLMSRRSEKTSSYSRIKTSVFLPIIQLFKNKRFCEKNSTILTSNVSNYNERLLRYISSSSALRRTQPSSPWSPYISKLLFLLPLNIRLVTCSSFMYSSFLGPTGLYINTLFRILSSDLG